MPSRRAATSLCVALCVALCGALLAARGLPAQAAPLPAPAPRCPDTLATGFPMRVPVGLAVRPVDSAARALMGRARALSWSVGDSAMTMLGARDGVLPPGEPAITWRSARGVLEVAVHRDGHLTWHTPGGADSSAATALLARALARVAARGITIPWPPGATGDSVRFELLTTAPFRVPGEAPALDSADAAPIFSVAVPGSSPVMMKQPPRGYPHVRPGDLPPHVLIAFRVDTTGRVRPETVHDVWPVGVPRLTGDRAAHYRVVLAAAEDAVLHTEFVPARMLGCAVSQVVEMPLGSLR